MNVVCNVQKSAKEMDEWMRIINITPKARFKLKKKYQVS